MRSVMFDLIAAFGSCLSISNVLPFVFSADRLQLPMEASCVSSSLFSTKIKKTLSLWVDYIFFQCQSGPACIHINPINFQATFCLKRRRILSLLTHQKDTRDAKRTWTPLLLLLNAIFLQAVSCLVLIPLPVVRTEERGLQLQCWTPSCC